MRVPASPQSLPRGQAGSQALCYAAGTRGLREAEERPEAVPAARTRAQPQHHHLRAGRLHGAPQRRFPTAGILHGGGQLRECPALFHHGGQGLGSAGTDPTVSTRVPDPEASPFLRSWGFTSSYWSPRPVPPLKASGHLVLTVFGGAKVEQVEQAHGLGVRGDSWRAHED